MGNKKQNKKQDNTSSNESVVMCENERTILLQALRFYAEQANYSSSWVSKDPFHVMEDKGLVARNALVNIKHT